jgi:hypothetical protein
MTSGRLKSVTIYSSQDDRCKGNKREQITSSRITVDNEQMSETDFWAKLVLAVLATWRVTHLLAKEDGPADFVVRLRTLVGNGMLGKLMDCFYCLSIWVAAPVALFVAHKFIDWLLVWLALSGAACLLERTGHDPVIIQPISQPTDETKGGTNNGMLWTKPGSTQNRVSPDEDTSQHTAGS